MPLLQPPTAIDVGIPICIAFIHTLVRDALYPISKEHTSQGNKTLTFKMVVTSGHAGMNSWLVAHDPFLPDLSSYVTCWYFVSDESHRNLMSILPPSAFAYGTEDHRPLSHQLVMPPPMLSRWLQALTPPTQETT